MILVGIIRTGDGFTVIDSEKREHACSDAAALWSCFEELTSSGEAETRGATHDEVAAADVDAIISEVCRGVGDYVGVQYGETLGKVAGRTSLRSSRGLIGFLKKVSRK